jgi:spermidine synthase
MPARRAQAAVAIAAFALFTLEPFAGKVLLPRLGGTPMVWNTCVMVFQALLLGGYLYSVWLSRHPAARRLHLWLSVAAAVSWPVSVRLLWLSPPAVSPVLWISWALTLGVGLPFVVLSATSPLMQVWNGELESATNTHRLYSVSNIASVGALITYVAFIEPLFGLRSQAAIIEVLLVAVTIAGVRTNTQGSYAHSEVVPTPVVRTNFRDRVLWGTLSFSASLILYAVNTYLATDVASFPLLFIIPLGLFLLGFAAGFGAWAERWRRVVEAVALAAAAVALWYVLKVATASSSVNDLPLPLLALAALVTALAARLAASRPTDDALPSFYTSIGAGGFAAGIIAVLVIPWGWTRVSAPFHDSSLWLAQAAVPEYPIALALGMALAARRWYTRALPAAALVLVATSTAPTYGMGILFQGRNFFGTVRVQDDPSSSAHRLKNGTTLHGFEITTDDIRRPTSYYHPASPIGQAMRRVSPHRVTAFGLGTGTLAAYALRGDRYTFLEINPLVVEIASNPRYFAYLSQARRRGAEIDIRLGDGRIEAARLPAHDADLVVLDAFSSDSIPVHLVTREAFAEYARALAPEGAIAVHVSNRFFDLGPSVAATAEAAGLQWYIQARQEEEPDESRSTWVMLVADAAAAARWGLVTEPWEHPVLSPKVHAWTDDWADLLGRLRFMASMTKTGFD